jgi:hypothetical protein
MPEETVFEKRLSEKIYFEDPNAKVTNVRVTCRHLTVPIEKIGSVNVNYKIETFSLAIMCLVISCSPFLFFPALNPKFYLPVGGVSLILIIASLVFILFVFKNYVELLASIGGRSVKLLSTTMKNKKYIEGICDNISDAILDDKKYQEAKLAGTLDDTRLSPSDTLRLKMILDDYEDLQQMKEDFNKMRGEKSKK